MVSKIPLSLTYLRILIIPFFIFTFFIKSDFGRWMTCGLFVFACLTDYLDGKLARSLNQESKLGALLDPIADKIIVAVAIMLLIHDETIKDLTLFAALIIIINLLVKYNRITILRPGLIVKPKLNNLISHNNKF